MKSDTPASEVATARTDGETPHPDRLRSNPFSDPVRKLLVGKVHSTEDHAHAVGREVLANAISGYDASYPRLAEMYRQAVEVERAAKSKLDEYDAGVGR